MYHSGLTFYWPDDLQVDSVTRAFVHYGVWLRLPYRSRTGQLFRFAAGKDFEVWVHNRYSIPEGSTFEDRMTEDRKRGLRGFDHYWSEVLLIISTPDVPDDAFEEIRKGSGAVPTEKNVFAALRYFNDLYW